MTNETKATHTPTEIAQGLTFDLVDACEVSGCGEGWLCEDHEPLFKGIVALAESRDDLLAALEWALPFLPLPRKRDVEYGGIFDGYQAHVDAAEAAITKARGEQVPS